MGPDFGGLTYWHVGGNTQWYPWNANPKTFKGSTGKLENIEAKRGRYMKSKKKDEKMKKRASVLDFVKEAQTPFASKLPSKDPSGQRVGPPQPLNKSQFVSSLAKRVGGKVTTVKPLKQPSIAGPAGLNLPGGKFGLGFNAGK